jgi:Predicted transcription factor, homolog of eukaryotic MBF1
MDTNYIEITLKAARVNAGLKQKEAAEKLDISVSSLQGYESGKTCPSWKTIKKMEILYDYPAKYIFFNDNHG